MARGNDMSGQRTVGVVGAAGLIIQIVLGFFVAGDVSSPLSPFLLSTHMIIGLSGVALVAYLVARAYYVASAGLKFLYLVTFIIVLAQIALGFRILSVIDQQLAMSHQGAG
ncbi:MAG: hypothetical protein HYU03_05475, partial [Thaumarchaeota archaeon]|nr:hypothetical protein [Nitrososphaerota archaeon]